MSVDILLGFAGLASLGQAAYFGVGAYLTAILATKYQFGLGWDFWLVVVFGILVGATTGGIFRAVRGPRQRRLFPDDHASARPMRLGAGLPMEFAHRRRQRHQHSTRPNFGFDLANEMTFFFLVLAFFTCHDSGFTSWCARRSAAAWRASASASCACPCSATIPGCTNTSPSSLPAPSAGLAGVLWAHTNGIVSPEDVVLTTSVDALLMVVLGGAGTLVGGAIGSAIVLVAARISSDAGAVVAIRAGRRLRADDSVFADRPDGHSEANPSGAEAVGK